ncbi:hypothetical protein VNI00_017082 [Paramarasmius palmivorus]|uniref:Uncharacterized protein n=1 Tax=Paramarasmius palmivorus TaxID=297713 RepID=A0AAW0B9V9_9AGAR
MTDSPASLVYPPTPCPNQSSPPLNNVQPASPIVPAPGPEEPFDFVKSREVLMSVKSSRNRMNEHVRMLEEELSSALDAEQDRRYTAICEMRKEHHELEFQVQHLQARKLEIEKESKSLSDSNKAAKAELTFTKGKAFRAKQERSFLLPSPFIP